MSQLANSPAADPSLAVQQEDQNRLAMEGGTAAFELNYPFVYPSMQIDNPQLFKHFKWALYPRVYPNVPSHVTIGGIDLAVSAYSAHPDWRGRPSCACATGTNQILAAVKGGLPPTLMSLYTDPSFIKAYPFAAAIKAGAADRVGAAEDPVLPERLDRDLARRVAAGRHQSRRDAGADHRRYQQRARRQGPDPVRSARAGRRAEER